MGYDLGKILQIHVNVRAFDGKQRDTIGEIDLHIQMGPACNTPKKFNSILAPCFKLMYITSWFLGSFMIKVDVN